MIGGDMLFKDYKSGGLRNSNRIVFKRVEKPLSTFTIVNIFLAQNLGSNPFIAERFFGAGLLIVLFAACLAWFFSQFSFNMLIRTWHYDSETSYAENLSESLGWFARFIARLFLILSLNTGLFYNMRDIYPLWTTFLKSTINNPLLSLISENECMYFFAIVFCVPFMFARSFISLKWLAYLSNIALLIAAICTLVLDIEGINKNGFDPEGKTILFSKNPGLFLNVFSTFIFQYYLQPVMCNLAPMCSEVTQGGLIKVSLWANFASLAANVIIGYLCWFILYGDSNGIVSVIKFEPSILTGIISLCCLIRVLITLTLTGYLIGIELTKFFLGNVKTYCPIALGGIVALLFPLGATLLPTKLYKRMGALFQLSFMICGFIWPIVSYLRMFGLKKCLDIFALIILIIIITGGIAVMTMVFLRPSDKGA